MVTHRKTNIKYFNTIDMSNNKIKLITKMFNNKTVLVTGGTVLWEKILLKNS